MRTKIPKKIPKCPFAVVPEFCSICNDQKFHISTGSTSHRYSMVVESTGYRGTGAPASRFSQRVLLLCKNTHLRKVQVVDVKVSVDEAGHLPPPQVLGILAINQEDAR